jgi:hypothetical protein
MNYDTLIVTPVKEMTVTVLSFVPTLFIAFLILFIGWIVTKFIKDMIVHVFKVIKFDKLSDHVGLTAFLHKGGLKHTSSEVIGCIIYNVMMVMVIILTVKALGLTAASDFIGTVLAYIPSVVSGALILIIGLYLARFVSALVYIAAKNTDMPIPATLSRLSKWAIVLFVTVLYLHEIGLADLFTGENYSTFITGLVFALALAFGLAGKDIASKYLDVFNKKPAEK